MTVRQPVRPLDALVALRKLLDDPDDTEQAFRVVRALDGHQAGRFLERFRASPDGARLLRERPSLLAALSDRDALRRLPEGSLGRAYLAFVEREGITADGLVEVSQTGDRILSDRDFGFLADRMRDSHDLFHVVTGYRTDLIGEASVLSFTAAQTESPGTALLVAGGFVRSFGFRPEVGRTARRQIRAAWRRGKRAEWLIAAPWERLLERPLQEVRLRYRLGPAPVYAPLRVADAA
ncbi:MAG: Coq4 family protein [Myxococcota bacterium]|nr:Coq4 family protein [Myxococcota bacterium]